MTISAKSKSITSKKQVTFSGRLTPAGALLAVFAASLLLIACPSPDGGAAAAPPTYTTTVTGTVTTLPAGESAGNLTIRRPLHPQVKHSGTFRFKVEHTCYDPVTVSADGSHDGGAISLAPVPEPTGTDRYSITPQPSDYNSYKLTVNCVRAIRDNEFDADGRIIKTANVWNGIPVLTTITEIALPPTLKSIGDKGLRGHSRMSKTLTIPRNLETLGKEAFQYLKRYDGDGPTVVFETESSLKTIGVRAFAESTLIDFTLPENLETIENEAFVNARFFWNTTVFPSQALIIPAKVSRIGTRAFARAGGGITTVDIRSDRLARLPGMTESDFPLQPNLVQSPTEIRNITLPQKVYDSYTKAELQAIFGSSFGNYLKPDGTAYDFAGKS